MRRLSLVATLSLLAMLVMSPAAFAQSEANDLDCADFGSQADAQAELRSNPSDPNGLDGNDDDGIACESLPGPRDEVPVQGAIGDGGGTAPPPTSEEPDVVDNTGGSGTTGGGTTADLDCIDFATQAEAQATYDADPSDPNGLDADSDGIACETTTDTANTIEFEDGTVIGNGNDTPSSDPTGDTSSGVSGDQYVADDVADDNVAALPDTGGPALLPVAALLLGLGGLSLAVLRRTRRQ